MQILQEPRRMQFGLLIEVVFVYVQFSFASWHYLKPKDNLCTPCMLDLILTSSCLIIK